MDDRDRGQRPKRIGKAENSRRARRTSNRLYANYNPRKLNARSGCRQDERKPVPQLSGTSLHNPDNDA
jgi:hypothetical protein